MFNVHILYPQLHTYDPAFGWVFGGYLGLKVICWILKVVPWFTNSHFTRSAWRAVQTKHLDIANPSVCAHHLYVSPKGSKKAQCTQWKAALTMGCVSWRWEGRPLLMDLLEGGGYNKQRWRFYWCSPFFNIHKSWCSLHTNLCINLV